MSDDPNKELTKALDKNTEQLKKMQQARKRQRGRRR